MGLTMGVKPHAQAVTMILIIFFNYISNVIKTLSVAHQFEYLFTKNLENEPIFKPRVGKKYIFRKFYSHLHFFLHEMAPKIHISEFSLSHISKNDTLLF